MFRFENEQLLYGLLIIPFIILIYILLNIHTRKRFAQYADEALLAKLMQGRSSTMKHIKFSLIMLALACFILALANPQVGSSLEKGMRKGVDIMVCMDVSKSMLAEDIKPNRLEASKMAMSRFVDKLQGDRIGLVLFAGKSFVQLPITSDYAAARMFLNNANPDLINQQGTDIAAALDLAVVSMLPEDLDDKDISKINGLTSKVIIVVSDGEDHFAEATALAKQIHEMGMTIHTIGIGSTRGEPIPIKGRNGVIEYQKDREGNTVMTRLNEVELQNIATAGGGVYVQANNANMGFETILDEINKMMKTDIQEITFARYESRYQIPLVLGLFFLLIEAFLFAVKPRWVKWFVEKKNGLTMKTILLLIAISLGAVGLQAQTKEELHAIRQGNAKYKAAEQLRKEAMVLQAQKGNLNLMNATAKMKEAEQKYQQAEVNYRKAMEHTQSYDKANYNLGSALYRQEKYKEAAETFKSLSERSDISNDLKANAYHNLGNSLLKEEQYAESINAYKNALKLKPSDMNSKYNLEYARKKLIQQQQQQQQNQQNQKKSPQDEEVDKILEEAKKLVAQRRYNEAYTLMKEGEKKNPKLKQHAEFTNRILDIIKMN